MILSEYEWQAVELSLKVSGLAVVCSLPFGILMAWVLVRCRFPGKALLDGVIHLPLVLPPVVVGYLLLIAMGRRGVIGEWLYDWFGFSFSFSWRGAALASAVVAFPLMVRAIRLALEAVDTRLEQAARTLGANPWRVFFTITLPLSLPGIGAGILICFIPILGEFVIPDLLGGSETLMLGRTLWSEFFSNRDWPLASAVAVVLLAILVVPLVLVRDVEARRIEARR